MSLKNILLSGVLAGSLALGSIGCGESFTSPLQPSKPPPEPVAPKSVYQTLELINDVDIDYTSTLENVSQATRKIEHNGAQYGNPTTIETSPYNELFDDMQKGIYSFRLEATGVTPHEAIIEVPDYAPVVDQEYLNSLETDLFKGDSLIFNLPEPTDKNPEDNPVHYTGVTSPDKKTESSIFPNGELKIKALQHPIGQYQVELEFGSEVVVGGLEKAIIDGTIFSHYFGLSCGDNGGFMMLDYPGTGKPVALGNPREDPDATERDICATALAWDSLGNRLIGKGLLISDIDKGIYDKTLLIDIDRFGDGQYKVLCQGPLPGTHTLAIKEGLAYITNGYWFFSVDPNNCNFTKLGPYPDTGIRAPTNLAFDDNDNLYVSYWRDIPAGPENLNIGIVNQTTWEISDVCLDLEVSRLADDVAPPGIGTQGMVWDPDNKVIIMSELFYYGGRGQRTESIFSINPRTCQTSIISRDVPGAIPQGLAYVPSPYK